MCTSAISLCTWPHPCYILAFLLTETEHIPVDIGVNGISIQPNHCVCVQVTQYRSSKEEARRAKLAEEQAELDDMQKKQAEEDVCFLSALSSCFPNSVCLVCCICLCVCVHAR